jgi:cyclopropane-fatty-acyl-phospholipid synthase
MLYKFKSPVAADVIMLQPNAEELLKIIGKAPGATGIVTAAQAPAAIATLRAEIARREAKARPASGSASHQTADGEDDVISLRHRATPFIELLECSSAAGKDVVWGV